MDDVLDSLCPVHLHGDIHGRVPVMVPLLLRGEDSDSAVVAVAGYQGVLDSVPKVRASSTVQERDGEHFSSYIFFLNHHHHLRL